MKLTKIISISVLCLAVLLSSCAKDESKKPQNDVTQNQNDAVQTEQQKDEAVSQENGTETENAPSEENGEDAAENLTEQPEEPLFPYVNPLTGLGTDVDLTNVRPVTLMVNNLKQALPQMGISEADVVYETLEEGNITRLLCVYNNYSEIPEIGSIRSARDYYIDLSDSHDAIFIHAGGSTYAYSALKSRKTENIDGLYMDNFYRSAERRKTMAKEHTLMISGAGIDDCIAQKGYRTTSENQSPLIFGDDFIKGQAPANHIEIPFSVGKTNKPYITSYFDYGSTSTLYHKGHFKQAHIDGDDGEQLTFKNVITITCPMNRIKGDDKGCIEVHFTGTGKGTYSVEGTTREIVWSKPSRTEPYTLFESDGETPLVVAPGKSYIAVISPNTALSIY